MKRRTLISSTITAWFEENERRINATEFLQVAAITESIDYIARNMSDKEVVASTRAILERIY